MATPDLRPGIHRARRPLRWVKRGLLIALGLAIVGAIVVAYLPKPVAVDIARVERETIAVTVEDDATTRVHDRYIVAAPTSGTLDRVELDAGATVAVGTEIARITPPEPLLLDPRSRSEATARLAGALAQGRQAAESITRARAARELAVREADRGRALLARGAITATESDRLELAEKVAIGDLATAEQQAQVAAAEVAALRATLGDAKPRGAPAVVRVTAPISGTVLRVDRDSAGPIAVGAPLVELGNPKDLEVVVDVLSSDAARIPVGAHATIEDWGGDQPLTGKVSRVEPSAFTKVSALGIEEQRVNIVIGLDAVPPGLGDGFRGSAKIELWRGEVLAVPTSALFRDRGTWAVYAIADGRAHLVPIEIGHRAPLAVEVVHGLAPGDTVVVHPSDAVRDGVRIAPR